MRRPRPVIAGGFYHVIQRGNFRQTLFWSEADYLRFLENLETYRETFDYRVHAFCLMTNHVHLLLETKKANISDILQRLMGAYTQYANRRRKRVGHLFQGRTRTILVDTREYLLTLSRYIHLNPVKAGMVRKPEDYTWSSMKAFLPGSPGPGWIETERTLKAVRGERVDYVKFVHAGIGQTWEPDPVDQVFLGGKAFVRRMWKKLGGGEGLKNRRPVPPETGPDTADAAAADRVLRKVAAAHRMTVRDLVRPRRKSALPSQARQAAMTLLRRKTTLTLREIGGLLGGISDAAVAAGVRALEESPVRSRNFERIVRESSI